MHGAHQIAHTSTTTTLPRRSLKESVEPSGRTPLKSMAVCPGFDHANRSSVGVLFDTDRLHVMVDLIKALLFADNSLV